MAGSRKGKKDNQIAPAGGPKVCRPRSPGRAYGIPQSKKGLLSWEHVQERMAMARVYWICTVSPDSSPHATPVDGFWLDDRLYFGGYPATRRHRNLESNPAVCVHLESGADVVILHGEARPVQDIDRSQAARLAESSNAKYGYGQKPEQYESGGGLYVFRPKVAFAWTTLIQDATRWKFPEED